MVWDIARCFLLGTKTAEHPYHEYAADQPIIDYHGRLPPDKIADNHTFAALTTATSVSVDVANDSYDTILARWKSLATMATRPSSKLQSVLSRAATAP